MTNVVTVVVVVVVVVDVPGTLTAYDRFRIYSFILLGFVGISLNIVWKEPKTRDPKDIEATERAMQFDLGWFANPIYGNGDYPEVMKKQIARKSKENGLPRSRLPEFTPEEIERNRGKLIW